MAQVIKPSEVSVVTKDGELQITLKLDININLNQIGVINQEASSVISNKSDGNTKRKELDDKVNWEIPDFGPSPKLKFGK